MAGSESRVSKSGSVPHGARGLVDMDGIFSPEERERVLARLNSLFAWVGARIPDLMMVDGESVRVRRLLDDLCNKAELDDEDLRIAGELEEALAGKERELKGRLKDDEISEGEALALLQETRGIIRALLRLRELGKEHRDLAGAALNKRIQDEKRWLCLLRSVGHLKR